MTSEPPTQVVLLTKGLLPHQFVVVDQWYPGWHAYLHSAPVAMAEGPDIFRTLTLTARQQKQAAVNNPLEMRYEPAAFRVGLYTLCLALAMAAAIVAAAISAKLDRNRRG